MINSKCYNCLNRINIWCLQLILRYIDVVKRGVTFLAHAGYTFSSIQIRRGS